MSHNTMILHATETKQQGCSEIGTHSCRLNRRFVTSMFNVRYGAAVVTGDKTCVFF